MVVDRPMVFEGSTGKPASLHTVAMTFMLLAQIGALLGPTVKKSSR